jgi:hypothetical protein
MPWNNVSKPTGATYTNVPKPSDGGTIEAGFYMGPLGLTYSDEIIITYWSNTAKPTNASWSNVAKPID